MTKDLKLIKLEIDKLNQNIQLILITLSNWEFELDKIMEAIRAARKIELYRKIAIKEENKKFNDRLLKIKKIKNDHEVLRRIIVDTYKKDPIFNERLYQLNFPTEETVTRLFDIFLKLDMEDLSKEGMS